MKVEEALVNGQAVTLDVYPYTAGSGRMIEYFNLDNPNEELPNDSDRKLSGK